MPVSRPSVLCVRHGYAGPGRCPQCQASRPAAGARFPTGTYGRRWRLFRDAFIQEQVAKGEPWCVRCLEEGTRRVFDEVDHRIPHRGDEALMYDKRNLQLLCKPHHSAKTAAEVGLGRTK